MDDKNKRTISLQKACESIISTENHMQILKLRIKLSYSIFHFSIAAVFFLQMTVVDFDSDRRQIDIRYRSGVHHHSREASSRMTLDLKHLSRDHVCKIHTFFYVIKSINTNEK